MRNKGSNLKLRGHNDIEMSTEIMKKDQEIVELKRSIKDFK